MKGLTVRLPVLNLIVSANCGVIGKNWPDRPHMLQDTLRSLRGRVAVQVSRQKEKDDGVILGHAYNHDLRGPVFVPLWTGHVVGTVHLLDVFRNDGDPDRFARCVREILTRAVEPMLPMTDDRLKGWFNIASTSSWSYVVSDVRLLANSFETQGSNSYFTIDPDLVEDAIPISVA